MPEEVKKGLLSSTAGKTVGEMMKGPADEADAGADANPGGQPATAESDATAIAEGQAQVTTGTPEVATVLPAESAVDNVVVVAAESEYKKVRRSIPMDDDDDSEPAPKPVVAAYKHKRVARFSVGRFDFFDHLLLIFSDDDNEDFLDLWEGLALIDKNAIVNYNYEAAMSVESAVSGPRVTTGLASTGKFKDPKSVK